MSAAPRPTGPRRSALLRAPDDYFASVERQLDGFILQRTVGRIAAVEGLCVSATGLSAPVGTRCIIRARRGGSIEAEIVAMRGAGSLLALLGEPLGISPGDAVECCCSGSQVPVGAALLGRVIDGDGRPLDGKPPPLLTQRAALYADPPPALQRRSINQPLGLGIRAIDAMLTAGQGQRLGIFAGTGVGKSVLMGMICRGVTADVNVVALIGERGREVRDFLDKQLGPEGLARSVVVVCTSDQPAALRVRTCFHATAIAEHFRGLGLNVLLMMDSLTRMAMAQRQIGLASGEPPTAKGYPPSAFALLPRLLERAGRTAAGSITGIYTVLVEAGDIDEPLADAVRGILDGHIWLARPLANRGHYPAIDVLNSISRVAPDVIDEEHAQAARDLRRVLATWQDIEDLVSIGAYVPGASREYDVAVQMRTHVQDFLRQPRGQVCSFDEAVREVKSLAARIRAASQSSSTAAPLAARPA